MVGIEKQGVELTVASISKARMTDGERKPWMLCEEGECTLDYVERRSRISEEEAISSRWPTS